MEAAVLALPERRRTVFLLARFHDLSRGQIAEMMGISPQTVANQLSSALSSLRESLAPLLDE
jgi:RNA polymerase sigma-70 factor (ECF subfamily)